MKVRTISRVLNGSFSVSVETTDYTTEELRRIDEQGRPLVEFGGEFTGPPAFTLPGRPLNISAKALNLTQSFELSEFANAKERAIVWREAIKLRIFAAMQELKDNDLGVGFNGEETKEMIYS